jgi:hypothetical protein
VFHRYPLPLIPELIARVKDSTRFSKFDIRWGYNNIRIKEGDEWKAAFITNKGLFEPRVMFFGLTNSPATFQTMMNALFEEELREGWLTIYMDNILDSSYIRPALSMTTEQKSTSSSTSLQNMISTLNRRSAYSRKTKWSS